MSNSLKDWRVEAKMTTEEAARAATVTDATWSRWETGSRKVPAERVLQIERMTGVSRHDLRPDVFGPTPQEAAE
jgi:DNA-binding transcriptional regulator YdaS (Cro superfamily)